MLTNKFHCLTFHEAVFHKMVPEGQLCLFQAGDLLWPSNHDLWGGCSLTWSQKVSFVCSRLVTFCDLPVATLHEGVFLNMLHADSYMSAFSQVVGASSMAGLSNLLVNKNGFPFFPKNVSHRNDQTVLYIKEFSFWKHSHISLIATGSVYIYGRFSRTLHNWVKKNSEKNPFR